MPRDSQTKMSKKESIKSKRREEEARKKKKNEESSDDDNSFYTDDDDDDEMDVHEYRKFLKKMFPSKHLDKKIKAGEKLKKTIEDDEEEEEEGRGRRRGGNSKDKNLINLIRNEKIK